MTEIIDPELREIGTHSDLLLALLIDKTRVPKDAAVCNAVEDQISIRQLEGGEELVYKADNDRVIAVTFKNTPLDSPEVIAFTDRLNKVRGDVAACLEQHRMDVVRLLQEATATIGKPKLWTPLATNASRVGKISNRLGTGLRVPLIHSNISDETHRLVEKDRLLTIAQNYTGVQTLHETRGTLPVRQRIKILRDAMVGCKYMHSKGLVNLDIKPGNILVLGENGLLNDLETTVKIWHPSDDIAKSLYYSEDLYFHTEYGTKIMCSNTMPAAPARDVFGFGISLLMTCAKKDSIENDLDEVMAENAFRTATKRKRERNLSELVDELEFPTDLRPTYAIRGLILKMLTLYEVDRISLEEAIKALEDFI